MPYLYLDAAFTHAGLTSDADYTRAVLHLTMFMIHPLQLHYSLLPVTTHKSSWAYMDNLATGLFPTPSGIYRNIGCLSSSQKRLKNNAFFGNFGCVIV